MNEVEMEQRTSGLGSLLGVGKKNDFLWVTSFTPESTPRFFANFMDMESDPAVAVIPIYISSYGGQVYSLTAMRDLIKSSTKPVATICVGMSMSCGASLLASGTKGMRFASPDSRIMIHEVSSVEYGKTNDIIHGAVHTKELNELMLGNLAKDCNIPVSRLKKMMKDRSNADMYLTADEALKMGLVDAIAIPRMLHETDRIHLVIAKDLQEEVAAKVKASRPKKGK
jgi:ATP-dependent Clp protease protease subunit